MLLPGPVIMLCFALIVSSRFTFPIFQPEFIMAPVNCIGVSDCVKCVRIGCKYAILKKVPSSCVVAVTDIVDLFADIITPGEEKKCPNFSAVSIVDSSQGSGISWGYIGVGAGVVIAIGGAAVLAWYGIKRYLARRRTRRSARARGFTNPLFETAASTGMTMPLVQFSTASEESLLKRC